MEELVAVLDRWASRIGGRALAVMAGDRGAATATSAGPTFLVVVDQPARLAFDQSWPRELGERGFGRPLSVHSSRRHVEARFAHAMGPDIVLRIQDPQTLLNLRTRGALRPISDPEGLLGHARRDQRP